MSITSAGANNSGHALRSLLNRRFSRLARKFSRKGRGRRSSASRQPAEDIISDALIKLIQKEIVSGLAGIFGSVPRKGGDGGPLAGDGNALPPFMGQAPGGGNFDRRQMEISIDEMVASSLMRGRQTSGVLRALFGLVPSLIGR